ncbi:MAG: glycosyltransferase family 4 protein [Bacteroidetes bacterium]|nr:glycosyltransferase family 4 protein [Bacteroidota bacterium]
MRKILFIASHRKDRAPGQRFRFEQYIPLLQSRGFHCDISFILNEHDDKIFYSQGKYFGKFFILLKGGYHRLRDVFHANRYDIIFIFREAFVARTTWFERQFRNSRAKIIYDFDDAIWHLDISDANKHFHWLKNPGKTAELISISDMVFCGNDYLRNFAIPYNQNVKVVPSTVDTDYFRKLPGPSPGSPVCIGWSGSMTTTKHFELAIPALLRIKEIYSHKVTFRVIGDPSYKYPELNLFGIPWTMENELQDISAFHIGIMPLPDDEWSKGKCGMKALLYMAMEIPAVVSPVGVNREIISDGKNGFLATTTDEWVEKLRLLIDSGDLRIRLGKSGRNTVDEKYSFHSQKEKYLQYFNEVLAL